MVDKPTNKWLKWWVFFLRISEALTIQYLDKNHLDQ